MEPVITKPQLTDSPWFWAFVYSGVPMLLLLVIAGKYSNRTEKMEARAQARQDTQQDIVDKKTEQEGTLSSKSLTNTTKTQVQTPKKRIVSETSFSPTGAFTISPFLWILGAICIVSGVQLGRQVFGNQFGGESSSTP